MALAISPFIFAGSAGNYYQGLRPQVDYELQYAIQQKADSMAYAAVEQIENICRKPINIILYRDLDKRPDGRIFQWDTWARVAGGDTLYTHTEIKQIR